MVNEGTPGREVGLVLGAGAATRFGAPKQLADFRGAPLITWPIRTLVAAGVGPILVVLGAEAEAVEACLTERPEIASLSTIVRAEGWQQGLSASLGSGVRAAAALGAARVLIALADQPLISPDAVARVLSASRGGPALVRASYGGVPAHPVALNAEAFSAVDTLRGDTGARGLRGYTAIEVSCDGLGSPADIDTPADLAQLR